ncbi:tetratricopeptide repeat protein [Pseudomaricurvus alkylphenolicus]|jgi:tetratricopeptide (TPR) repeat protein|uniref:tetratricopeptide repeat protein n=1 Tax=Pseudomaricurvus alkylphenolicus TaxID=1306991 RepID=UPI00141FE8D2|nr:tetratricopeptide repeat protein [Pseudomaricurvus alkylphenolicus]
MALAFSLLQGCVNQLLQSDMEPPAPEVEVAAEPEPAAVPERSFPAETLYALLVAEMAGSRERYDIALGNYVQQAHMTRDPGVAARATRIARYLNARQAALNTSLLWVEISPEDLEARFIAATELAQSGRLLEALEQSNYLLENHSTPIYQSIAARAAKATDTQREQLVEQYQQLQQLHPGNTELLIGLGLLYQQQNQPELALEKAREALAINNELIPAAVLEAKLLSQLKKPEEAIKRLAELLASHPENTRLRLQYARLLASLDLAKAQQQFALLVEKSPNDPEMLFSLALISHERDQLEDAKELFERLTQFDKRRSSAHYYLGRISEKQQRWDDALNHYIQVEPGPDFMAALLQTTDILVRGNQAEAANKRLSAARERFPSQAERFYLLEAEVLSKHLHLNSAEKVLTEGLGQFPASIQLLYSRAMVNEQLDMMGALETDLRTILKYDPNNATALNALGYTLADRTDRYEEAYVLISQALQIKPDDPAIIDSMGWVQYRLGNYEEALLRLRQAMQAFPDHEIAAHLGEVLWITGQKEEARLVWEEGLKLKPGSRVIPEVIDRLQNTETATPAPEDPEQ